MSRRVTCPECGARFSVAEENDCRKIRCASCRAPFAINDSNSQSLRRDADEAIRVRRDRGPEPDSRRTRDDEDVKPGNGVRRDSRAKTDTRKRKPRRDSDEIAFAYKPVQRHKVTPEKAGADAVANLLLGLLLLVLGAVFFFYAWMLEQEGGSGRVWWLVAVVYQAWGKIGIGLLFGIPGSLLILMGFIQAATTSPMTWPCPDCGGAIPKRAATPQQFWWGGGTCLDCGCDVNMRGAKWPGQSSNYEKRAESARRRQKRFAKSVRSLKRGLTFTVLGMFLVVAIGVTVLLNAVRSGAGANGNPTPVVVKADEPPRQDNAPPQENPPAINDPPMQKTDHNPVGSTINFARRSRCSRNAENSAECRGIAGLSIVDFRSGSGRH